MSIRSYLALIALALVSCGAFLGSRGIFQTTESRYAECAREMVESGHFLEPTLDYRPHWTKPPLTYWVIAAGIEAFGRNPWAVRLPNLMLFVVTMLAVGRTARLMFGSDVSTFAMAIFATSPMTVFGASVASTDTPLACMEMLMVMSYVSARSSRDVVSGSRWMLAMWFFAGLAFFTKGPPGLIALIPIVIWQTWHRSGAGGPAMVTFLGLVVFAVTALWWYALISYRHPDVLSYWLKSEVEDRILSSTKHHNSQWYKAFSVYGPVLLLGTGVWSYYGFGGLVRTGAWKPARLWEFVRRGADAGFLALVVVVPVVVFAAVNSRLHLYLLPVFGPIAILTALGVRAVVPAVLRSRRIATLAAGSAIVFATIRATVPIVYMTDNDMTALYKLCRQAGSDTSKVYTYWSTLAGLQFHLDGDLQVATLSGTEPWADVTLRDVTDSSIPWMIVSRNKFGDDVASALSEDGATFDTVENQFWILFIGAPREGPR